MENLEAWKDAESQLQNKGRVTTDAVYRRFRTDKKPKNNTNSDSKTKEMEKTEDYFCKECNTKISGSLSELKSHFENVKHNPYGNCLYCTGPVFVYKCKKKCEPYHTCKKD